MQGMHRAWLVGLVSLTTIAVACSTFDATSDPGTTDGGAEAGVDATADVSITRDGDGAVDAAKDAPLVLDPYGLTVLADAPIAYWRFDEKSGSMAKDSTGNGHTLSCTAVVWNIPGAIPPGTAGDFEKAVNAQCELADSTFDFTGNKPFSVELWARRDDATNDDGFIGKTSPTSDPGSYTGWFFAVNTAAPEVTFRRLGMGAHFDGVLTATVFHHLVGTFDGTTLQVYVDGMPGTQAGSAVSLAPEPMKMLVGAVQNWGGMKGLIDEVAVYDKELPPDRVSAHFNARPR